MGQVGELLRALALRPDAPGARCELAGAYHSSGDDTRAIIEYRKVLWSVPNDLCAQLGLGEIFFARGDSKAAAAEFQSVLASQPDSVQARKGLERCKPLLTRQ